MKKQGFTVVELVIIIIVIGILASITILGYGTWRSSVTERQLKSDLNGVIAAMDNARNFDKDGYPVYEEGKQFDNSNSIFESSDDVVLTYAWGDAKSYCIQASSAQSAGIIFFINTANGNTEVKPGSCPPSANGGNVSTIVNGSLNYPTGIAVDSAGTLYVAETGNHRILKITPAGVVSVLAGGTQGYLDANGTTARFSTPYGVAVDTAGNVYVADHDNVKIRMITPAGDVSTYAGSTPGTTNGYGTAAQFDDPYAVIFDPSTGFLYVSETWHHRIRKIDTSNVLVSTYAGSTVGYVDATGTSARFDDPIGLAIHGNGNVYVVEHGNDKIRKIDTARAVTTVAGSTNGFTNGIGTAARFNNPTGIGIYENVAFIADSDNNRVRMVNLITREVSTLAGSGVQGDSDAIGEDAQFSDPTGIAVDDEGIVYIVESASGQIRKIQ